MKLNKRCYLKESCKVCVHFKTIQNNCIKQCSHVQELYSSLKSKFHSYWSESSWHLFFHIKQFKMLWTFQKCQDVEYSNLKFFVSDIQLFDARICQIWKHRFDCSPEKFKTFEFNTIVVQLVSSHISTTK